MDSVAPLTKEEEAKYVNIDFDPEVYRQDIGAPGLMHGNDKAKTLMARWRYPSLSLHGIQGAFADPGAKTVIPRKVIGKFSIRIVPNQTPEIVEDVVVKYCNKIWATRKSPNKMTASDDGAHSQNEKIDIRNYIEGTKLLGAYAYELGQL